MIVPVVRCIACVPKVSLRRQAARRALKPFEFWLLKACRWRYSPQRGVGRIAGRRSKDWVSCALVPCSRCGVGFGGADDFERELCSFIAASTEKTS